jgi:hypothetical protein
MQAECGVVCEKGTVAKKAVFSLTNIVNRKRALNLYTSPNSQEMHALYFFGREKIGSDIRALSVLYGTWLLPFPEAKLA